MSGMPIDPALLSPGGAVASPDAARAERPSSVSGAAFGDVLARNASSVQFSGHALQRIERRGIPVGQETLVRLEEGLARAAGKGARESVVFVDGTAFVVSVRNRTVITAVDPGHMRDHVFTNIDSAVIA